MMAFGSIHSPILPVRPAIGSVGARILPVGAEVGALLFELLAICLLGAGVAGRLVGGELCLLGLNGFAVRLAIGAIGLSISAIGPMVGAVLELVAGRGLSGRRRSGLCEGDGSADGRDQGEDRNS
jgi:hypothetical protein